MFSRVSKKSQAFSLIEVSIIILVVSALLTSMIGLAPIKDSQENQSLNKTYLDEVEQAIQIYYMEKGYLPCPASRNALINTASFGAATACVTAGSVANQYQDVGAGVDRVRIGTVPTKELNLPDYYAFDSSNNRITYAVIASMATTSSAFSGYTSASSRVITIVDSTGAAINPVGPNFTPYVLLSHGTDGAGAGNYSGSAGANINLACIATNQDGQNCDYADATFRDQTKNLTAGATYYDDIIRWKTLSSIKSSQLTYNPTAPTNGVPSLKVGTYFANLTEPTTPFTERDGCVPSVVAPIGCASDITGITMKSSTLSSVSVANGPTFDQVLAPTGRYIIRMSVQTCKVTRGVGLIYYTSATAPTPPVAQIGRHTSAYSYAVGGNRCSRNISIAMFDHTNAATPIRFRFYMDQSNGTYDFGVAYNPTVGTSNNSGIPQEFVQIEIWQMN